MCGGNLRKRFELRVMTAFSLVWSSDEDKLRYAVDYISPRQGQPLVEPCFLRL